VPWYFYAFALLLPLVLRFAVTLVYRGSDLARQEWLEFVGWSAVALALVVFDRAAWRSAPPGAPRPPRLSTRIEVSLYPRPAAARLPR
jgi:hypothetical protein